MTLTMQSIAVKHNMEIAHRLFLQPGKCQQIHGHGMQVTLTLYGEVNEEGIFASIDYSDLKKAFRSYIDETYDHRLLLNLSDPFARPIFQVDQVKGRLYDTSRNSTSLTGPSTTSSLVVDESTQHFLPGLQSLPGDPTTENLSLWIAQDMQQKLYELWPDAEIFMVEVEIWETATNSAKTQLSHDTQFMQERLKEVLRDAASE